MAPSIDQLPLLGLVLPRFGGDGIYGSGRLELFDSSFHQGRCDFAATGLFHGPLPGLLRLFGGQANQRPHLPFMFGFGLVTNGHQMRKHLGRRDQAVDGVASGLPSAFNDKAA